MLRIFIGLQAIKFYCFPPPGPPPPVTTFELFSLHHHISIVFLSTTTTTTFQLFSPHHHHISTVRKQKVVALKRPPPFTLNVPVNIARTLVCTGHWSWNVLNAFGTITTRVVLYAITRFPRGEIYMTEGSRGCHDCGAVTHKNAKTLESNFYSPSTEENEEED